MARALVVRLSALGDVVHGLGAAEALARAGHEVHWVVQRPFAPLFAQLDWIGSVVLHDRASGVRGYWSTGRRLRALRPEVALDFQGNWKSAGLTRLSGAPRRIGAARASRQDGSSLALLNESVESVSAHPARVAGALVQHLEPGVVERPSVLRATAEERDAAAEDLRRVGLDPARPFRAVVWSDQTDPRGLSAEHVAQLVADSSAVVLLGPDEVETPAVSAPLVRHERGSLRRLVGLGALLAEQGGEAFGPDRGATHVLAASGARTTVHYGPTSAERTGPLAAAGRTNPRPPSCQPCFRRQCNHPDGPVCRDYGWEAGVLSSPRIERS